MSLTQQKRRARAPRVALASGIAIALTLSAAACSTDDDSPGDVSPLPLTLLSGVPDPNPTDAEHYVALEKGWYEDAGLEIKTVLAPGGVAVISALQAGQADVAQTAVEQLPEAVAQGADLVAVYQTGYSPIIEITFPENSKASSVADLKGATIGVPALTSIAVPLAKIALEKAGIDPDDVTIVAIGFGAQGASAIEQGLVDAAMWCSCQFALLEGAGIEFQAEAIQDLEGNYPAGAVVVARDTLNGPKREAVIRYLQVVTKAREYCQSDLEGCVDSYIKQTGDPTDRDLVKQQIADRLKSYAGLSNAPDANGIQGFTNAEYWQTLIDTQSAAGLLSKPVDADQLFTTELLEDANEAPPSVGTND